MPQLAHSWQISLHTFGCPGSVELSDLRLLQYGVNASMQKRIDNSGDGVHSSDDGADLDQKVEESLRFLLKLDCDGGNFIPECGLRQPVEADFIAAGCELVDAVLLAVYVHIGGGHDVEVVLVEHVVDVVLVLRDFLDAV